METLPPEIIITIARNLGSVDCLNFIRAHSQYDWLLRDKSLWKSLAWRELRYPPDLFEFLLCSLSPTELYQQLAQCHHLVPISSTEFVEPCKKPIFPGTSFCRQHLRCHGIEICLSCEIGFIEKRNHDSFKWIQGDRFCPACLAIDPATQKPVWMNECKFGADTITNSIYDQPQCGAKRQPGSDYCTRCNKMLCDRLNTRNLLSNNSSCGQTAAFTSESDDDTLNVMAAKSLIIM